MPRTVRQSSAHTRAGRVVDIDPHRGDEVAGKDREVGQNADRAAAARGRCRRGSATTPTGRGSQCTKEADTAQGGEGGTDGDALRSRIASGRGVGADGRCGDLGFCDGGCIGKRPSATGYGRFGATCTVSGSTGGSKAVCAGHCPGIGRGASAAISGAPRAIGNRRGGRIDAAACGADSTHVGRRPCADRTGRDQIQGLRRTVIGLAKERTTGGIAIGERDHELRFHHGADRTIANHDAASGAGEYHQIGIDDTDRLDVGRADAQAHRRIGRAGRGLALRARCVRVVVHETLPVDCCLMRDA